ncbi:toxin-antitoxin system YwqK family antitoxin [Roseivirga sp.]|uniref:toxin-antitoxin system YwqK family antitoxin n=1 Tax=Roseivirga sp. TaxID=1964215 RepID=UPI003B8D2C85
MKTIYLVFLPMSFLLVACTLDKEGNSKNGNLEFRQEVPEITIEKSMLQYDPKISLWLLNGKPFSGFAISHYEDGSLMEKIGILDGKRENKVIKWYPDGHFKNITNYHEGKLHGEKKVWTSDSSHVLIAHYNFYLGRAHGKQRKWYSTGEPYKILTLNMGKEEGIQQAFRENGALYANYEARGGRIFGLKKAALCYGLEEESFQARND